MLKTIVAAIGAVGLWFAAFPGTAQTDALTLEYDIILSGVTTMGNQKFKIYPDAEAGVLVVEGEQRISIMGRTVDITWTEKWRDDRLVAYDGLAEINRQEQRSKNTITLREDGAQSVLTVNGTARPVPAGIAPGTWWRKSNVVGRKVFFEISDGDVYEDVPFQDGEREITYGGKQRVTEFWKVRGGKARDFWFLNNGVLVKYQRPRGATWYTYELTAMK